MPRLLKPQVGSTRAVGAKELWDEVEAFARWMYEQDGYTGYRTKKGLPRLVIIEILRKILMQRIILATMGRRRFLSMVLDIPDTHESGMPE